MYAVKETSVKVNDVRVDTFCRKVDEGDTTFVVEAGSTGYRGGEDRDSGSRAYACFFCCHGDFLFVPIKGKDGRVVGVEIAGCGDAALDAFAKALGFARKALDDARFGADD